MEKRWLGCCCLETEAGKPPPPRLVLRRKQGQESIFPHRKKRKYQRWAVCGWASGPTPAAPSSGRCTSSGWCSSSSRSPSPRHTGSSPCHQRHCQSQSSPGWVKKENSKFVLLFKKTFDICSTGLWVVCLNGFRDMKLQYEQTFHGCKHVLLEDYDIIRNEIQPRE